MKEALYAICFYTGAFWWTMILLIAGFFTLAFIFARVSFWRDERRSNKARTKR